MSQKELGKKYGPGFDLLKKMGYQPGEGLGAERQGIVNPIKVKVRKGKQGLSENEPGPKQNLFGEKTKQAKDVIESDASSELDDSVSDSSEDQPEGKTPINVVYSLERYRMVSFLRASTEKLRSLRERLKDNQDDQARQIKSIELTNFRNINAETQNSVLRKLLMFQLPEGDFQRLTPLVVEEFPRRNVDGTNVTIHVTKASQSTPFDKKIDQLAIYFGCQAFQRIQEVTPGICQAVNQWKTEICGNDEDVIGIILYKTVISGLLDNLQDWKADSMISDEFEETLNNLFANHVLPPKLKKYLTQKVAGRLTQIFSHEWVPQKLTPDKLMFPLLRFLDDNEVSYLKQDIVRSAKDKVKGFLHSMTFKEIPYGIALITPFFAQLSRPDYNSLIYSLHKRVHTLCVQAMRLLCETSNLHGYVNTLEEFFQIYESQDTEVFEILYDALLFTFFVGFHPLILGALSNPSLPSVWKSVKALWISSSLYKKGHQKYNSAAENLLHHALQLIIDRNAEEFKKKLQGPPMICWRSTFVVKQADKSEEAGKTKYFDRSNISFSLHDLVENIATKKGFDVLLKGNVLCSGKQVYSIKSAKSSVNFYIDKNVTYVSQPGGWAAIRVSQLFDML